MFSVCPRPRKLSQSAVTLTNFQHNAPELDKDWRSPQPAPPYGAERSCPFLPKGQGGGGGGWAVLSGCR